MCNHVPFSTVLKKHLKLIKGMKKILLLFIILFPVISFSQGPANGDGTSGSPYSGLITTPWTLSGDKYCGDLTVSSGTFTISAGATLRFGSSNSLTISGTGVLSAVGNSSSYITFTAAGTSWGHIAFDDPSSTSNSNLNYCIIEHGSVSGSGYAGAGGGILIRHSYATVSNSIIRNNSSDWGGGIFIDNNQNPHIYKCLFKDNTTIHGGGGIYCWNGVSSVIENCIFDSNHCTEPSISYYSGGAVTAQSNAPIQVLNCTFVNNTSTQPGDALLLSTSSGAKIVNCIFWGSSDQIAGATSSQVDYCAIEGSSEYTHTVTLTHSGATGPNFTAIDGSDWSIKFISPCRDFGVNSYTGVTIPTSDYIGNPTIGTKDIGTYEVQYSRWLTNAPSPTSWSSGSNWEQGFYPGYTGTTGDVIIPSLASSYAPDITGTTTISSGKNMVLNPGAKATFGTLSNSGTLKLESDATTVSSLITNSFTGSDATVELNLSGGEENPGEHDYRWHYISTPVDEIVIADIFPPTTYHVLGWYDNRVSGTLLTGWAAYDGWLYYTDPPGYGGPTFSTLTPGKGYNYYCSNDHEYTFSGQLNTGNYPMSLAFTYPPGSSTLNGYNLLGNPYSSGLNWDDIADGIYFTYPAYTSKGLNYTKNNAHIYYINGISTPENEATGIIPPMQGFFVKTYSSGNSITIPAAARTHSIDPVRYKGNSEIPLIRLSTSENGLKDEMVVRLDESAKSGLDYDFDAVKIFVSSSTQIYSVTNGINFAINGLPFPVDDEDTLKIPVVVNLLTTGNHILSSKQQGLSNYKIKLKDKVTGFSVDLKNTPDLAFSAVAGFISDRFLLMISNIGTGIEKPVVSKNIFNIYQGNDLINIQTIADEWEGKTGTVRVLDLTGKTVSYNQNSEFWKNSLIQIPALGTKGLYIVEIKSGVNKYVGKVVIK